MLAAAQGAKVPCALIDMERSFDPKFAKQLGLNTDDDGFLYLTPGYGEEAFEVMYKVIKLYKLVVVDSVAALVPKAEMEASGVKWGYSKQSIIISSGLRKLVNKIANAGATVIFVNQLRDAFEAWSKDESPGGRSLKFYASLRLRMSRIGGAGGAIEADGIHVGHLLKIHIEKCKISPHEREEVTLPIVHQQNTKYPIGVDRIHDLLELAIQFGIVNMYTHKFGDVQFGTNREIARANLRQNAQWVQEVREAVYQKMGELR
jgi:recombination protein RecA